MFSPAEGSGKPMNVHMLYSTILLTFCFYSQKMLFLSFNRSRWAWNLDIFRLEVVLRLEVQCKNISSFALTCF